MSKTYDLGAVFDEHVADEFVAKDVAATMSTMTAEPFVDHVPTMTGGVGGQGVAGRHRQGGRRDGDELHARRPDGYVPAWRRSDRAGRRDGIDGDKVAFERIYWDQASLLVQVGLLDDTSLPVTGAAQARKVLDKDLPANELLKRRG